MIQLTDKVWAVEVPDKIDNPNFYRVNNEAIMFKWDDVERPLNIHDLVRVDKFYGDLKYYKWPVFLFTTKTATEEDARKVVRSSDWHFPDKHIRFVDYKHPFDKENKQRWGEGFGTAVESLASLIRSKNCDPNKNYALIEKQSSDE